MILYRVLQSARPTRWDFLSHEARGVQPRGRLTPLLAAEWAGVSAFDTVPSARAAAEKHNLGRFIAVLDVPEDGSVAMAQTVRLPSRHHFTMWADAAMLQARIVRNFPVDDAE